MKAPKPEFSRILREARPAPSLPPRFQQDVWRRIQDAEAAAQTDNGLDALVGRIFRPRFAFVAAAVLLLTGVLAGTMEGRQIAKHEAQMNYLASVAQHSAR